MPQMAPISWLSLFMVFSLIFIFFNMMNYFYFFPITKNNNNNEKKLKMTLHWKW